MQPAQPKFLPNSPVNSPHPLSLPGMYNQNSGDKGTNNRTAMAVRGEERNPIKFPISNPPYGTFSYPPQAPPPSAPLLYPQHQQHLPYHAIPVGNQSLPCSAVLVEEGIPVRVPRLPFCGMGVGWALFVSGFFLAAIPWYVGVFILLFVSLDYREKPGLVACTVAAAIATLPFVLQPLHEIFGW